MKLLKKCLIFILCQNLVSVVNALRTDLCMDLCAEIEPLHLSILHALHMHCTNATSNARLPGAKKVRSYANYKKKKTCIPGVLK